MVSNGASNVSRILDGCFIVSSHVSSSLGQDVHVENREEMNEEEVAREEEDLTPPTAGTPQDNNGCDSAGTTSGDSPSLAAAVTRTASAAGVLGSASAVATAGTAECGRLHVEISDALSEKDKVKFTVHVQTNLPYHKQENHVVRQHEEFVWLHDLFEENEDYAGYIVSILAGMW